jgi:hypothetical protein
MALWASGDRPEPLRIKFSVTARRGVEVQTLVVGSLKEKIIVSPPEFCKILDKIIIWLTFLADVSAKTFIPPPPRLSLKNKRHMMKN